MSEHNGQHRNCRACGTNPRAKAAQEAEGVSPASLLPTVVADEREPLTAQERMTAQTGLSRARQALEAMKGKR